MVIRYTATMYWYRIALGMWLITDVVVFLAAYCLGYFVRVGFIFSTDYSFAYFFSATLLTVPLWLLTLLTTRVFGLSRRQVSVRNGLYIFYATMVACAMFITVNYFSFELQISRRLLLYLLVFPWLCVWVWHVIAEQLLRLFLQKKQAFKMLIIGITRESTILVEQLLAAKHPFTPVALLDGKGAQVEQIAGVPNIGKLNKLEQVIDSYGITHLLQCSDLEQSLNLISVCRNKQIHYLLLPSVLGIIERDERIESLDGNPVTSVAPQESLFAWFFK